jgi:hypothetical protein
MRKPLSLLLVAVLTAAVLLIASCNCAATTTPTTTTPMTTTPTTTTPTTTTPTTTTPTTTTPLTTTEGETLGEILGRSANISSVKYDMVVDSPGKPPITTKMWIKGNKMRMETTSGGQLTVTLLDMDALTMYKYYPNENKAMTITYKPTISAMEGAQAIPDYNPTVTGHDTLDGKYCLVVEYTAGREKAKTWIWEEHGFPIRVEIINVEGFITDECIIIEYKNIEFVDIPDSMFEIPEGVEMM